MPVVKIANTSNLNNNPVINKAANIIKQGGLVVFPTETVYGLGADALNEQALQKIYKAKGRPSDNPLIAHISNIDMLSILVSNISSKAYALIEAFWPGPLTLILPKKQCVPDLLTAGLATVAVRWPSHLIAQTLITQSGVPIAAPSANLSGKPSPTIAKHAATDLGDKVDLVIDGGACEIGVESTIVNISGQHPTLLRPGGVTKEDLEGVLGTSISVPTNNSAVDKPAMCPGTKYRHYAPFAQVTILRGCFEEMTQQAFRFVSNATFGEVVIFSVDEHLGNYSSSLTVWSLGTLTNLQTVCHNLFAYFRQADAQGFKYILVESFDTVGVGLAIMNRLERAAKKD